VAARIEKQKRTPVLTKTVTNATDYAAAFQLFVLFYLNLK